MDNGASSYRRFISGDNSGLEEIIEAYNKGLTFYLNSFVNNLELADELSEETFVKLGVKKPHYSDKASFKTWLYTIGRNIAVDYIRKSKRNNTVSLDVCAEMQDEKYVEAEIIKEEQKKLLYHCMRKLKPEYEQALWLVYFEVFSTKECAEVMKKSVHATENIISRAKANLKTLLQEEGFVYENL